MGKNKLAKFEEMKAFEHVVQAPFHVIKHNDFHLKGKWGEQFFGNDNPIILELGCGKGEYTISMARKFPDKNFLGIDIKGARIWRGAKTANEEKILNAAFLRTRIELISSFFGKDEVAEIWLTFVPSKVVRRAHPPARVPVTRPWLPSRTTLGRR